MTRQRSTMQWVIQTCAALATSLMLLLVPVRCDASPEPHSIFIDPVMMSGSMPGHQQSAPANAPAPAASAHTGHGSAAPSAAQPKPSDAPVYTSADPGSLKLTGGALDAPVTLLAPVELLDSSEQPVSRRILFPPAATLIGVPADPWSPPPRALSALR